MLFDVLEGLNKKDIQILYDDILEYDMADSEKIVCCACTRPTGSGWCMPYTGPCNAVSDCQSACANIGLRYNACDTGWSTNGQCVANGVCN